jgi:hypothetical protein
VVGGGLRGGGGGGLVVMRWGGEVERMRKRDGKRRYTNPRMKPQPLLYCLISPRASLRDVRPPADR